MKRLTISTYRYKQLLEDFVTKAEKSGCLITLNIGMQAKMFYLICQYNHKHPAFTEGLMTLLTHIVIQENPLYHNSPKLQGMAHDLRGTSLYETSLKNLVHYLVHCKTLHLEGYVIFRMGEYREKLDMMSYSLIKKLKLIRQD